MNNFNPLVSIIIPVYNGSNYMREAIDSALAQIYKNIEIIVVNDGSTDNTEEIALSYGNKIKYFSKENGGVATALNLAIEKAQGEYISWLSHDDLYLPHKIERQIEELNKLEDKNTILYTDYYAVDSQGQLIGNSNFTDKYELNLLNKPLFPLIEGLLHGCTLLIKKTLFIEFEYFDINLITTQDYDLWFKILRKYSICYIAECLIKSRSHDCQGSKSLSFIHQKEGNDLWCSIIDKLNQEEIDNLTENKILFFKNLSERMKISDLDKASRKALLRAFTFNDQKNILLTSSMNKGGLGRFIYDMSHSLGNLYNVFILYVTTNKIEISCNNILIFQFPLESSIYFDKMFCENAVSEIIKLILPLLDIRIVHISGFLLFGFNFLEIINKHNIPIVYTVHDFHTLCISQHFLDARSQFCDFNQKIETCHNCLKGNIYAESFGFYRPEDIKNYRNYIHKFVLPNIDKVVFPTPFVKTVFELYLHSRFKDISWEIIEHGIDKNPQLLNSNPKSVSNKKILIGIIGSIHKHKGLAAIKEITEKADINKFEFILLGDSPGKLSNTKTTGKYTYKDTIKLLASSAIDIALVLSEAPETYSYVISECWGAKVPVITTNMGAQAERVQKTKAGWIVNRKNVVEETLNILGKLSSNPQEIESKRSILNHLTIKTRKEMVEDYMKVYSTLISSTSLTNTNEFIKDYYLSRLISLEKNNVNVNNVNVLYHFLQKIFTKVKKVISK